jgi:O-antigen/teichoic acid export membrane protein
MARHRSRSRTSNIRGPDSILKNAASSFAAQMTTAALTAVLTLFLVRALGPRQYGLFAVAIGFSTLALVVADFGISGSTSRFVAEHRGRDAELHALIVDALKMKVVVTGFFCTVIAALASVVADVYGDPSLTWPLRGIAIATFGQSMMLMMTGVAMALGRSVVNVRLVALESLFELSASVALVLAGAGAVGAAFGRAFGYAVGFAISAFVVVRMTGREPIRFWRLPRRATVGEVGVYARSVFAIEASYTVSASLPVLLLGAYAGSAASGIFQAPAKLIVLMGYVGLSTAYAVAPRLSKGAGQQPNVSALNGALRGLIGFQCLMLAPAVVWAGPITRTLLGAGYSQSADVLRALAPYIFFYGLASLVTVSVNYVGEAQRRLPIALATLALIVAGCAVLIPRYGVVGAAVATDIAFGFYTLAHVWLCRRLFKLRLGMLVWSLMCALTAAAAMGIVLAAVGTKHLTIVDWLKGGVGGVAAYVAMLIFTREIRGADIARATAALRTFLARLDLRPRRPRSTPTQSPPRGDAVAGTGMEADVPRAGASSTIEHVESAIEVSHARRDERRRRDRLGAVAGAIRSVLGPTRHRPSVPRLARAWGRPPSARPPGWLEELAFEPGARDEASPPQRSLAALPPAWLGEAWGLTAATTLGPRADGNGDNEERSLRPAAQPSAWLSDNRRSREAGKTASAAAANGSRSAKPSSDFVDPAVTSGSGTELIHQIAWRLDDDGGVFELRPVDLSDSREARLGASGIKEQSPPVLWRWRMGPAPIPEARRAHEALVARLLASGWQRAGTGDTWYAHLFRPPDRPRTDKPRDLA